MVKHVIKRDGRIVDFDKRKIVDAVLKAMDVTEQGEDIVLAAEIAATISKIEKEDMSVEEIQDVVEMELMNSPRKEVAKKYIAYRNQRNLARKAKSREIFKEIIEAQATDVTRENANMNADTPAGMMMKFASESTKSFVDECLLSEEVKDAVTSGKKDRDRQYPGVYLHGDRPERDARRTGNSSFRFLHGSVCPQELPGGTRENRRT